MRLLVLLLAQVVVLMTVRGSVTDEVVLADVDVGGTAASLRVRDVEVAVEVEAAGAQSHGLRALAAPTVEGTRPPPPVPSKLSYR